MAVEYISREAAMSFPFANGQYDHENADPHFINGCESYREWLEAIPAADVRPVVRGKWTWIVRRYYEEDGSYTLGETIPLCSKCGKRPPLDVASSFCPYCGADMREVEHD